MRDKTKMIFCHDNRFETKNNKYYSNGIFINDNMTRYTDIFDKVTVISRNKVISNVNNLIEIDNPNVEFKCLNNLKELFNIKTRKALKEEVKNTNYIIARIPSLISLLVLKYAKIYNKPYLVEVVGDTFGAFWNHSLLGKIIAPYITYITKSKINNSKYVFYVTNNFLQKRYPTKGQSIACSDVELERSKEQILQERLERINNIEKREYIYICTIGAVNVRYKGQKYVIKAIAKLKKQGYKFKYLIVGNGNQKKLKKIVKKYRIENNIEFVGGISHEKIFKLLDNVDIYVQSSIVPEGLPRSIIEAMSRGCLCIGTNIGGIPELIEKYLYKGTNSKELEKILKSITKNDLYETAKVNFDKSKQYEKTVLVKRRKEFFKKFLYQD